MPRTPLSTAVCCAMLANRSLAAPGRQMARNGENREEVG